MIFFDFYFCIQEFAVDFVHLCVAQTYKQSQFAGACSDLRSRLFSICLWCATNKIAAQNVISKKLRSLRLNFAINYISINQHSSERSKLVLGSNSVADDVFAREFCICSCNKKYEKYQRLIGWML